MEDITKKFILQELNRRYISLTQYPLIKDLEIINYKDDEYYEECLKTVMVKYFPKMKDKVFGKENKEGFFNSLYKITYAALGNDYRFLDAFNNAYEVIMDIKWDKEDYEKFIIPFFKVYKFLLWSHLKK
jgi:hypothetical protein